MFFPFKKVGDRKKFHGSVNTELNELYGNWSPINTEQGGRDGSGESKTRGVR
jgi:hypothetical protein